MNISKHHQIVIFSVGAIVMIFCLHFLVFSDKNRAYSEAKLAYDQAADDLGKLKVVSDANKLKAYTTWTQQALGELSTGLKLLELDQPAPFVPLPNKEQIPASELKLPSGFTPEQEENGRTVRFYELLKNAEKEQVRLFAREIDRLRDISRKPEFKNSLSFLGPQGWNFITELPPRMQSNERWDLINQVAEIKGTLDSLAVDSSGYADWRRRYDNALLQLGLNTQQAKDLRRFGQFVPLYYRTMIASLIVEALPADRSILIQNRPLIEDPERPDESKFTYLYSLLENIIPFEPTQGITESNLYFAYEELRNLNNLIELSKVHAVQDITGVYLRGFGYLRQKGEVQKPAMDVYSEQQLAQMDDEADVTLPPPTSSGITMPSFGGGGSSDEFVIPSMGGEEGMGGDEVQLGPDGDPIAPAGPPRGGLLSLGGLGRGGFMAPPKPQIQAGKIEGDIGYALPIKITFVSANAEAWTYIYEVLRAKQMVELHRLQTRSLSQFDPNNSNIEVTATFLMVPKLFETIDSIKEMLKGSEAQAVPAETAADGPAAQDAIPGAVPPAVPPAAIPPAEPAGPVIPGAPPIAAPGVANPA